VRVVLTREAGVNEDLRGWLTPLGEVTEVPLTATRYRASDEVEADLSASGVASRARTLVVTSARAARYARALTTAMAPGVAVLAVGRATAAALGDAGVSVTTIGVSGALALADQVAEGPVVVLGAVGGRPELAHELHARGLEVVTVACYETVGVEPDAAGAEALRRADVVVVGAPSAWRVAREHVGPDAWVVVPGETTAIEVAREHGRVVTGWGPDLAARLGPLGAGGGESGG
jgi:uroporphyrinogen-III synthase